MTSSNDPLQGTALHGLDRARAAFSTPLRELQREKKNWQLLCFLLAAVDVLLVLGIYDLSRRGEILLHVVELDRLGQARYIGPPKAEPTNERFLVAELADFIRELRVIHADPRALFEERKRAYAHLTPAVRSYLEAYFEEPRNDPRKLRKRLWREVRIDSVLPLSETSWQVRWVESEYRHSGQLESESSWVAVLDVLIEPPSTPEKLQRNPLGVYVTALSWTPTNPGDPR